MLSALSSFNEPVCLIQTSEVLFIELNSGPGLSALCLMDQLFVVYNFVSTMLKGLLDLNNMNSDCSHAVTSSLALKSS